MVIADRWILTAAHVVEDKNGQKAFTDTIRVSPHGLPFYMHQCYVSALISSYAVDLQIFMGLTDAKDLSSPVYPSSIHVHPGYNNPNLKDFNNDIALIKLQDPITFHSSIMPVCLPAKNATYTTGVMG